MKRTNWSKRKTIEQVCRNKRKQIKHMNGYSVEGLIELFCCSKGNLTNWKKFRSEDLHTSVWNLHTRVREHKQAVCKGETSNGIAVHVIKTKHPTQREKARTITTEPLLIKRKVKESLMIRRTLNDIYFSFFLFV